MSRIDEALKALERGAGVALDSTSPEAIARSSRGVSLDQYPGERAPVVEAQVRREISSVPPSVVNVEPRLRRHGHKPGTAESKSRLIHPRTPAVQVEQYRRLAASLHDAQFERGLKTVMVTSAVPREGKTLTAVNLALTLSESFNRQVLLIDADLRWPSIHEVLELPNTRGLSEALREDGVELPLVEISRNFTVLTAGQPGSRPLAGLTSERMGSLLDEFETRFDWILLDTPPVGFLPDARLLARLIRSAILVIGAGSTPAHVVERAVAEIGADCIVGTVLNRIEDNEISDAGYYYGYGGRAKPPAPIR